MIHKTNRLSLREISVEDIPNIHLLHSFPEVDQFNTLGIPKSLSETESLVLPMIQDQATIPRQRFVWLIQNDQKDFIGLVGIVLGKPKYFSAEIWYKIHPLQWNRGYASEVVEYVLSFCFTELKLHRVCAGCAVENKASIKVLEKNRFIREGRHRKILPIRGQWIDNYEYAILEEDYFKN